MEIERESLDGLLIALYQELLTSGGRNEGGRGANQELLGVTLRLTDPLARLSRSEDRGKPFSALGELLWYLSASDTLQFIKPYVPRYEEDAVGGILPGAYGPRLFRMRDGTNQIENVTDLLRSNPGSRRAVVQLFNAEDIETPKTEIPCTTTLQFHLRDGRLNMSVTMRSNDAYWGLPHDVFCFTMLQEMMAKRLGATLGCYIHHAGSMHVYDDHLGDLRTYIEEGYHRVSPMPEMPDGDPFELIPALLSAEDRVRHGEAVCAVDAVPNGYWADIVRLVQAFWASGRPDCIDQLSSELVSSIFRPYVEGRRSMKVREPQVRVL
jgi:thymidylate synthase